MLKDKFIEIFPSLECDFGCNLCDRGNFSTNPLETNNFKNILILEKKLKKRGYLIEQIRITGKEPLEYKNINSLINFLIKNFPNKSIFILTNGKYLERLSYENLIYCDIVVSVYPKTKDILKSKYKEIKNIYMEPLEVKKRLKILSLIKNGEKINFHHDLDSYGTKKKQGFSGVKECLSPVLLGNSDKIYPCCRAHTFEKKYKTKYKTKYHITLSENKILTELKNIIRLTSLCNKCPFNYEDPKKVFLNKHLLI